VRRDSFSSGATPEFESLRNRGRYGTVGRENTAASHPLRHAGHEERLFDVVVGAKGAAATGRSNPWPIAVSMVCATTSGSRLFCGGRRNPGQKAAELQSSGDAFQPTEHGAG
jgi:hypothetical protein